MLDNARCCIKQFCLEALAKLCNTLSQFAYSKLLKFIPWILTTILYSPVFYTLYTGKWDSVDYTHAYFILPLSLFIVWTKRKEIVKTWDVGRGTLDVGRGTLDVRRGTLDVRRGTLEREMKGYFAWLVLVIFSLLLFILGWRQEYVFIQVFSLIPLLLGMTTYLYGWRVTRMVLFPILYLLLLVPPPLGVLDSITLPMRYGVSIVSAGILKIFNYPIIREGLLLKIGSEEVFMGEPCSGFRSLITMFSLGLIYIYFSRGRMVKNIILFGAIVPLALLGNLIRVLSMCLVTYYLGYEVGQGFYHDFSGMVVFVIIILGLIGLEKILGKKL